MHQSWKRWRPGNCREVTRLVAWVNLYVECQF